MKKILYLGLVGSLATLATSGCSKNSSVAKTVELINESKIGYQIFTRSFADSNGDGIGDLKGIENKLDYLEDLGVGMIWLTPFQPTGTYHGYDIEDYQGIDPRVGDFDDWDSLVNTAKSKGISIIMDTVFNHSSCYNDLFKRDDWKDYYSTTDTPIGGGWHEKDGTNYYGYFWDCMPDLDWENEKVIDYFKETLKFWLDKGVSGFRFDAVKHVFDFGEKISMSKEKTNDENAAKLWKELKDYVKEINPKTYLIAENWQGNYDSIGTYQKGFDSQFNFPLHDAYSAFSGDANSLTKKVISAQNVMTKYDKNWTDAPFVANHDNNRIASVIHDQNVVKMIGMYNLSLPGMPWIYYGEELGMKGMKPDEQIREAMKWKEGFEGPEHALKWYDQTRWDEHSNGIVYNHDLDSVEKQIADENSFLNAYKSLAQWRVRHGGNMAQSKLSMLDVSTHEGVTAFSHSGYNFVFNFTNSAQNIELEATKSNDSAFGLENVTSSGSSMTIKPYSMYIGKK